MADFTIPPRAISAEDLAKISTLRILINTQVENTTPNQDSACAAGLLHALVANALYQGRYYRVADIIWGDVYGASKAYDKAQVAQSGHGYSNFTTETLDDTARLTIDLTIKIQSQMQHRQEEIELKRTPYKRDDIVSKEKQERIPRSVADLDNVTVRKEKAPHDYLEGTAKGSLAFQITLPDGREVYSRQFSISASINGENACPTEEELITGMVESAVKEFMQDISPTRISRMLQVNESGDKKAVLLLKAKAYNDAIVHMTNLTSQQMTASDYENLGIAYEILGEFSLAEDCFQKAKCESGLQRIAQMKQNSEAVKKLKGTNGDTEFKK